MHLISVAYLPASISLHLFGSFSVCLEIVTENHCYAAGFFRIWNKTNIITLFYFVVDVCVRVCFFCFVCVDSKHIFHYMHHSVSSKLLCIFAPLACVLALINFSNCWTVLYIPMCSLPLSHSLSVWLFIFTTYHIAYPCLSFIFPLCCCCCCYFFPSVNVQRYRITYSIIRAVRYNEINSPTQWEFDQKQSNQKIPRNCMITNHHRQRGEIW